MHAIAPEDADVTITQAELGYPFDLRSREPGSTSRSADAVLEFTDLLERHSQGVVSVRCSYYSSMLASKMSNVVS
jgi:hypothetical protein